MKRTYQYIPWLLLLDIEYILEGWHILSGKMIQFWSHDLYGGLHWSWSLSHQPPTTFNSCELSRACIYPYLSHDNNLTISISSFSIKLSKHVCIPPSAVAAVVLNIPCWCTLKPNITLPVAFYALHFVNAVTIKDLKSWGFNDGREAVQCDLIGFSLYWSNQFISILYTTHSGAV